MPFRCLGITADETDGGLGRYAHFPPIKLWYQRYHFLKTHISSIFFEKPLFVLFSERVVYGRSIKEPFDFLDADIVVDG